MLLQVLQQILLFQSETEVFLETTDFSGIL